MLWQDGRASVSATNFKNFAWLVNCGYNATKAIYPSAKVIVHVANGFNNTTTRWIFDGLKANGASWDVCGFSVYPINQQLGYHKQPGINQYAGYGNPLRQTGNDLRGWHGRNSAATTSKAFFNRSDH
jgi:arabinogalactan endo-1,4-beta-galactosidase